MFSNLLSLPNFTSRLRILFNLSHLVFDPSYMFASEECFAVRSPEDPVNPV